MYSSNPPQSFAPTAMSAFDQDHLHQPTSIIGAQKWPTSQIQATGDIYTQPPSQGDMGHPPANSNNQFSTGYRELGQSQPTMIVDTNKAPSLIDMSPGQGSSYNYQDPYKTGGLSSGYNGPPSHSGIRPGGVSHTSDSNMDGYSKDEKAPGLSDVDRRGSSETGVMESVKLDDPDAQDFVGISLVGKNFRKFYPNAYSKEQDEENEGNQ